MPLTSKKKENEILITFQAIIDNSKQLYHVIDRIGEGYALCMYKLGPRRKSIRKSRANLPPPNYDYPEGERLETYVHTMKLKSPWAKEKNHTTTLFIIHNPASDSDSMSTSDAPMI